MPLLGNAPFGGVADKNPSDIKSLTAIEVVPARRRG